MAGNISDNDPDEVETERLRGILIDRWIHTGESHIKVARETGLSPQTVKNFRSWETKRPQTETLRRLGKYFGLRLTWVEDTTRPHQSEVKYPKSARESVAHDRKSFAKK